VLSFVLTASTTGHSISWINTHCCTRLKILSWRKWEERAPNWIPRKDTVSDCQHCSSKNMVSAMLMKNDSTKGQGQRKLIVSGGLFPVQDLMSLCLFYFSPDKIHYWFWQHTNGSCNGQTWRLLEHELRNHADVRTSHSWGFKFWSSEHFIIFDSVIRRRLLIYNTGEAEYMNEVAYVHELLSRTNLVKCHDRITGSAYK